MTPTTKFIQQPHSAAAATGKLSGPLSEPTSTDVSETAKLCSVTPLSEYQGLCKGKSSTNCCGFWSIYNVLPSVQHKLAFSFNNIKDPTKEFINLLKRKNKKKTGYTEEDFKKYFNHLVASGIIKSYKFEQPEGWVMPHFIATQYHREEESFILMGKSPTSQQVDKIQRAVDNNEVTEKFKGKSSRVRRGGRGRTGPGRRTVFHQRTTNESINPSVETTDAMVLRGEGKSNTHAVGVRFVTPPQGYPDCQRLHNGSKVPILYDTRNKKGWPVSMELLNRTVFDVTDIFLVSIVLH